MILKNNLSFKAPLPIQPDGSLFQSIINSKIGRVNDIILDENHPRFEEVGEWAGVGTIFFEENEKGRSKVLLPARPFFPQSKYYPLKNELIFLFLLSDIGVGENYSSKSWYYLNNINLWNTPHQNAYPNLNKTQINSPIQNVNYQQSELGLNKQIVPKENENDLLNSSTNPSQNTFEERSNVHPLLFFNGDLIHEGRWGNSIRLGSTAKSNSTYKNSWSGGTSKNGDPILIFRNGQPTQTDDRGWVPIVEDLSKDMSSLWMTSTQKIPFNSNIDNLFKSFSPQPPTPSIYTNPQIIGTSDRILLYAKKNDILLGAERSIDLSTNGVFKVNSSNFYVDNNKVKLGDKNANESVILGDSFLNEFKVMLDSLSQLCEALTKDTIWPGGVSAPNVEVNATSANLLSITRALSSKLSTLKSKISKTI